MKQIEIKILRTPMLKATQEQYFDLKAMYMSVSKNIKEWKLKGLNLEEYERIRRNTLAEIGKEKDIMKKNKMIHEMSAMLRDAAVWLAIQELAEDMYMDRFSKEVDKNMKYKGNESVEEQSSDTNPLDEKSIEAVRGFAKYINAKRLMHIINSLVEGLGYTPQEVCQECNYDIFAYIHACEYVKVNAGIFESLYEEMINEQHEQDRYSAEGV